MAALLTLDSAWQAEATEEGGGTLTGPMIDLALLGGLVAICAVVVASRSRRTAVGMGVVASVIILPWLSWLISPGLYCGRGHCSYNSEGYVYPLFEPGHPALTIVLLLVFWVTLLCIGRKR